MRLLPVLWRQRLSTRLLSVTLAAALLPLCLGVILLMFQEESRLARDLEARRTAWTSHHRIALAELDHTLVAEADLAGRLLSQVARDAFATRDFAVLQGLAAAVRGGAIADVELRTASGDVIVPASSPGAADRREYDITADGRVLGKVVVFCADGRGGGSKPDSARSCARRRPKRPPWRPRPGVRCCRPACGSSWRWRCVSASPSRSPTGASCWTGCASSSASASTSPTATTRSAAR